MSSSSSLGPSPPVDVSASSGASEGSVDGGAAAAGAGTNYAFVDYYVAMAHVHFGLRKIARVHGEGAVSDYFHKVLAEGKLPQT